MRRLPVIVGVRFSPQDRALLEATATELGVKPSTLMRKVTIKYLLDRARDKGATAP